MSTTRESHCSYRPLTERERRLILRLLEPAFPGRDELLAQLENIKCLTIDSNGSLELCCRCSSPAPVRKRIPTEGEAIDSDGTMIHYLLHVVSGMMCELEVYKDDSSAVDQPPDPDSVEVMAFV